MLVPLDLERTISAG